MRPNNSVVVKADVVTSRLMKFQTNPVLFDIFSEIRQVHVALACQCVVHSECSGQAMACLSHLGEFEVFAQQRTVIGVSTVLDDEVRALDGALATEVGHTLFGNDDVDIMLRVVLVADEGNDRADHAVLGC